MHQKEQKVVILNQPGNNLILFKPWHICIESLVVYASVIQRLRKDDKGLTISIICYSIQYTIGAYSMTSFICFLPLIQLICEYPRYGIQLGKLLATL